MDLGGLLRTHCPVSVDIAVEVVAGDPNDLAEPIDPKIAADDHSPHMLGRDAEFFGHVVDGEKAFGMGAGGCCPA